MKGPGTARGFSVGLALFTQLQLLSPCPTTFSSLDVTKIQIFSAAIIPISPSALSPLLDP